MENRKKKAAGTPRKKSATKARKARTKAVAKRKTTARKKPAAKRKTKSFGDVPAVRRRSLPARQQPVYPIEHSASGGNALVTALAVGAAGVLGYFGWQHLQKLKQKRNSSADAAMLQAGSSNIFNPTSNPSGSSQPLPNPSYNPYETTSSSGSSYTPPASSSGGGSGSGGSGGGWTQPASDFPLHKGSKGAKVKALQQALISKYGSSVLPRYGADGDFGSETASALAKAGLPATISESTFNVLVQGSTADISSLGQQLYAAAQTKNFSKVLSLLQSINSKTEYQTISNQFLNYRIDGGVRQTLVNGLLNRFSDSSQKEQIRYQFLRMGLKYDGSKWSLDGLPAQTIITTEPTNIWLDGQRTTAVSANTVLGVEVARKLDYTLFENGGKHFLVQTKSVKYHQ